MFSRDALGRGISSSGLIEAETQRDASYQHTESVVSLQCGAIEVQATFGVSIVTVGR